MKAVSDISPEPNQAMPSELCLLCPSFPSLSEGGVDEEVQGCFCLAQKKNFLSCTFLLLNRNRKMREPVSPFCFQLQDCLCGLPPPLHFDACCPALAAWHPPALWRSGTVIPSVLHVTCDCFPTHTKILLTALTVLIQLHIFSFVYLDWCCACLSPSNHTRVALGTLCVLASANICPHCICLCISPR